MTVESALLDELKKRPATTGRKTCSTRGPSTRPDRTGPGWRTTTFEKTKTKNKDGQEQDTWKQVAPAAKDVDQTTVDNLISAVTQARAASFVDAAPKGALDAPELAITLTSNDGKRQEKVTSGRVGPDVFASRAGEPGTAKLDASAADGIVKALGEIK